MPLRKLQLRHVRLHVGLITNDVASSLVISRRLWCKLTGLDAIFDILNCVVMLESIWLCVYIVTEMKIQ